MTIFLIILIILAIPFILATFLTNEYVIEKQTTINRPRQAVLIISNFCGMPRITTNGDDGLQ
jgi:hypothetical protein